MFRLWAFVALVGVPIAGLMAGAGAYRSASRGRRVRAEPSSRVAAGLMRGLGAGYLVTLVFVVAGLIEGAFRTETPDRYALWRAMFVGAAALVAGGPAIGLFRWPRILVAWAAGSVLWAAVGVFAGAVLELMQTAELFSKGSALIVWGMPAYLGLTGMVFGPAAGLGALYYLRARQAKMQMRRDSLPPWGDATPAR